MQHTATRLNVPMHFTISTEVTNRDDICTPEFHFRHIVHLLMHTHKQHGDRAGTVWWMVQCPLIHGTRDYITAETGSAGEATHSPASVLPAHYCTVSRHWVDWIPHTHLLGNPLRTAGEIFHRPAVVSAAPLMVPKYWTYWPGDIVVLSVFVINYSKCHFNLLYVISILSLGFCLTGHFSVATIDTKQSPVNLPWITSWNCCYSILHSLDGLPYHQLAVLK